LLVANEIKRQGATKGVIQDATKLLQTQTKLLS
jgi:hypothetical protein